VTGSRSLDIIGTFFNPHGTPPPYNNNNNGATTEYPATIVPDSTCAHIFKERDMCSNSKSNSNSNNNNRFI